MRMGALINRTSVANGRHDGGLGLRAGRFGRTGSVIDTTGLAGLFSIEVKPCADMLPS